MAESSDRIRNQMQKARGVLDHDVEDLVESTREMKNWRRYYEQFPWVALGLAVAAGYLVVPKRVELVSPSADDLVELARRNKLVVKRKPKAQAKRGLSRTLFTLAANAGLRAAIAFAGQKLGKAGGKELADTESTESGNGAHSYTSS